MNQQKFVELLQGVQVADTERIKASTAELRKTYYPNPESLLWLLQILTSHDNPQLRQQAAVEALRLVPKHWEAISADQKPAIREQLLQSTLHEQTALVRHSAARVIASVAAIDLDEGQWGDLPKFLVQAATSPQVGQREVGTYILFTLIEVAGDGFIDKLSDLFNLFRTTIQDPESQEVRINTMMSLSRVAMLFEPEEDQESLEAFRAALPAMVQVLKTAVAEGNEDHTMQAFEVFQTLLGCESALLANHFKDLLVFMMEMATETNLSEEARSQALSFLMQCVKYRRMKIQGMKDMGEQLTLKSMQIVTEIGDFDTDEDDMSPFRGALGLLDLLASSLPPRQVVVPLLKALPSFVKSENPNYRRAGILSLGMCVEGAPDFIATQLTEIMPVVLALLNDHEMTVRQAALHGVARLADDLAEDMGKEHAQLVPALLRNLDSANVQTTDEEQAEKNLDTVKAVCNALDSLMDGLESEVMAQYVTELLPRLGGLISHDDFKVKASAIGAIGSIAGSAGEAFLPYFETTMKALESYVTMKDSDEELDLRGTVCDAMGCMAAAVGAAAFQPYVHPLMQASEEALHLGHPRLRETSYILWSTLAKVYETEFTPFLDGVVKGLLESLDQEEGENEVEMGAEASELFGKEVIVAGKKVKITDSNGNDGEIEDLDPMEDEDDEDDWDDLTAVTAVALEKEIAVEVIGDVLSHTRQNFIPYLEKTIESVMTLVEHSYEGCRKAAIGTLWRAYACLWALMEDHTGTKWTPGLPLKQQPTQELLKLGEVVATATMSVWGDEVDREVVTDINRNVAATLKLCGPAILTQDNMMEQVSTILGAIITRAHPCQQDLGDEEDLDNTQESSEYDWLVIDTALDVIIGLAQALGPQFGELWKLFEKPVMKFASSQETYERSTAIGVIAECTAGMGAAVTPHTSTLLKLLLHRLSDEDPETRSNAAYATGLLVFHSTNTGAYLSSYNQILAKLEPLLHTQRARTLDNASGCVSRMIMAHADKVPISDVLPVLVNLLPLKEDFEENKPIFECIVGLYQHGNETVQALTPKLMSVFASVLAPPQEQLDDETREKVKETVRYLAKQSPSLVEGNEVLTAVVRG